MKVYLVFVLDGCFVKEMLKVFSNLDKAIEYATDFVMEKSNEQNRDHVKETITFRYCTSCFYNVFDYTSRGVFEDQQHVGILEVDAEINTLEMNEQHLIMNL